MGGNMENLLLAGDSSSGESDTEGPVGGPATVAAPKRKQAAAAPVPAPVAAPRPAPNMSQDLKSRLKSLYSPANKKPTSNPPIGVNAPLPPSHSSFQPQQRHQQQQQQQQQQRLQHQQRQVGSSTHGGRQSSSSRPSPQHQQSQVMRQPPAMAHPSMSRTSSSQQSASQPLSSSSSSQYGSTSINPDPFEPTPLHGIKERESQSRTSSSSRAPTSSVPSSSSRHPSSKSGSGSSDRERDLRHQKERFLMFTQVLVKYLEKKDFALHQQVKAIIKDCAERNKRQERGYESTTASMRVKLKQVVSEAYWKRAESYLQNFLAQKQREEMKRKSVELERRKRLQQQQQPQQQQHQHQRATLDKAPPSDDLRKQPYTPNADKPLSTTQQQISVPAPLPPKKSPTNKAPIVPIRKPTASTVTTAHQSKLKTPAVPEKPLDPPREYSNLMQMVDHAVNYDWTTAGMLLGNKSHITLADEQKKLLYSESLPALNQSSSSSTPFPLRGWGRRNLVSTRVAWACVRGKELESERQEKLQQEKLPVVDTGGRSDSNATTTVTPWLHEERAEEDLTLTLLSEATQIYVRKVLEKALACARQRQNLDGIRLWHQQCIGNQAKPPPLSLRLGCDVTRQVARAMGNAALTCKRMEQALERKPMVESKSHETSIDNFNSMGEYSLCPLLARGVQDADYQAKRSFEIFGGKESQEPPLGRVPKRAKIELVDFQMGQHLSASSSGTRRRHMASPISPTFLF